MKKKFYFAKQDKQRSRPTCVTINVPLLFSVKFCSIFYLHFIYAAISLWIKSSVCKWGRYKAPVTCFLDGCYVTIMYGWGPHTIYRHMVFLFAAKLAVRNVKKRTQNKTCFIMDLLFILYMHAKFDRQSANVSTPRVWSYSPVNGIDIFGRRLGVLVVVPGTANPWLSSVINHLLYAWCLPVRRPVIQRCRPPIPGRHLLVYYFALSHSVDAERARAWPKPRITEFHYIMSGAVAKRGFSMAGGSVELALCSW